ncbi:MAG: Uma2 family endonuclease [Chloroflexi bacterium]|nr:Uma2 family endonuclease [Chloroflexota bacterium]
MLDGDLIMAAAPSIRHQFVIGKLYRLFSVWVIEKQLGALLISPVDVVLGDDVVEPDLIYVSNARQDILGEKRITGAPDLVVEVLALSTARNDLRYKWRLYARSGIQEYWIVNPAAETVALQVLVENDYQTQIETEHPDDVVTSKVLQGFSVVAADVFIV